MTSAIHLARIEAMTEYVQLGWEMTRRDLAQRYRGTVLGVLWPFLYAAAMLAVFTLVFSLILKVRWPSISGEFAKPAEGALMIFAGLTPYLLMAEVISRSPTAIVGMPNLVKKVRFPLTLLPMVIVGSAAILSLINVAFLVIAQWGLWGQLSRTVMYVPLLYLPMILLLLGVSWALAALGVYFRDLAQIAPLAVQLLMFLAPVCYPRAQVPEGFARIIDLNPLTYFVDRFRDQALLGQPFDWESWATRIAAHAMVALLGLWLFRRTKSSFADQL